MMLSSFVSIPRVAIAHASTPESSGDLARVTIGRGGETVCFLGDVAGHGPLAAALARDLERQVAQSTAGTTSPGALLRRLNAQIEATWPTDRFVSAVCFSFDGWTGRGRIAVAGQLPPIVSRPQGARPLDVSPGPGLGIVPDAAYPEVDFFLAPGDVVVATTDGITDALASPSDLLGLGTLSQLVDCLSTVPNQICAALLDRAGRGGFRDDATVLVARHQPFELESSHAATVIDLPAAPDATLMAA